MEKLLLTSNIQSSLTIISNEFIDQYMLKADGEFVKIYLLLLRLTNTNSYTGPEQLADLLEITQKDVARALNYWKKAGLLTFDSSENEEVASSQTSASLSGQTDTAAEEDAAAWPFPQAPARKDPSPKEMAALIQETDLKQTLYMVERYIGHPLSQNDIAVFHYISQQLHFTPELMEYLVEYCVTKEKKSIRYMEKVAIKWYQEGIDTVKKARAQCAAYTRNVFPIMKAFGISGRNPAPPELDFIRKWNSMGFDTEILLEACGRTMMSIHQASFPYTNSILETWKKSGVRTMADIRKLDEIHVAGQSQKDSSSPNKSRRTTPNSFHNYPQRSYDYDDLEAQLLKAGSGNK